jgi:hypothetical protein
MKRTALVVAAVALMGLGVAVAQDSALPGSLNEADRENFSVTTDQAPPAYWSDFDPQESTLLAHAIAVHAALQAREAAERTQRDAFAADDCRLQYRPGSLIMANRCFTEVPGEEEAYDQQDKFAQRFYEDLRQIEYMITAQ